MSRAIMCNSPLRGQNALPTHRVGLYAKNGGTRVIPVIPNGKASIMFPKAIHASLNPLLLNRSQAVFVNVNIALSHGSHHYNSHKSVLNELKESNLFKYLEYSYYFPKMFLSRVGLKYREFSSMYPFLCSMVTGGCVLTFSDFIAQNITMHFASSNVCYDYQRTLALFTFGFLYYGIICKGIYLGYDKILGTSRAMTKAMIDCGVHTPFLLIPSFYMITGTVKGQSIEQSWNQLKNEWKDASGLSVLYWIPIMGFGFHFVSQESRILFITAFSLVHKSVLSWYSNRNRIICTTN